MQREQAAHENNRVVKYMEDNKLRPLFHELTKLLLLKKPADPIQFLIDYLQKRNKRQVICLHGYNEQSRIKLAKSLSNKFNYACIELADIFKGVGDWNALKDTEINEKVMKEVEKVGAVYKGIIISGYPNNIVQTDHLQKSGVLPERYFVMENDEQTIRQQYERKFDGSIEKLITRNRLELKELEQTLGDQIDYLPVDYEQANEKILNSIGLKANKRVCPYDSPRILILHPPYLKPESATALLNNYSLNAISVNSTLKKLSSKENFIKHVESYIRKNKCISKQIELAMIETMCKSVPSKNKGYAILGWPSKVDRLPLLKEHFLKPHLIVIFEEGTENAKDKFNRLDFNDSSLFSVIKKPSESEYLKQFDEYCKMVEELKGRENVQVFRFEEEGSQVCKAFLNLMDNPKIYS